MFDQMLLNVRKWIANPVSEALRKSPEMVKAKTEAQILKAEEDFQTSSGHSKTPRSDESIRLVPRFSDENPSLPNVNRRLSPVGVKLPKRHSLKKSKSE
jgi:hypothetical protein